MKWDGFYKVIDIDQESKNPSEMQELQSWFLETTGEHTVPRIYMGGNCIGGNNQLQQLKASGALDQKIDQLVNSS